MHEPKDCTCLHAKAWHLSKDICPVHSLYRRKHSEMRDLLLTGTSHCFALAENNLLGPANAPKNALHMEQCTECTACGSIRPPAQLEPSRAPAFLLLLLHLSCAANTAPPHQKLHCCEATPHRTMETKRMCLTLSHLRQQAIIQSSEHKRATHVHAFCSTEATVSSYTTA